jgi:phosphoglycerate dehydrogenase-like enzyme
MQHPILRESDIPITNSSGIHGPPIAEWTVMNWLVASRNHAATYEAQKSHKWLDKTASMRNIHDQVGKKVGILGYGSIGRQSMYSPKIKLTQQLSGVSNSQRT